jgi:hypothetical protein
MIKSMHPSKINSGTRMQHPSMDLCQLMEFFRNDTSILNNSGVPTKTHFRIFGARTAMEHKRAIDPCSDVTSYFFSLCCFRHSVSSLRLRLTRSVAEDCRHIRQRYSSTAHSALRTPHDMTISRTPESFVQSARVILHLQSRAQPRTFRVSNDVRRRPESPFDDIII